MGNRRYIFKNLLMSILVLLAAVFTAQEGTLNRADQLYRAQNHEQAALAIDSAASHPQTTKDFVTWTTRAYIYYAIYVRTDKQKLNSKLRDTVLISLRKSIALNPDSDVVQANKKLFVSLSAHYFNIAKSLLEDSINYDRSLLAYGRYKELLKLHDIKANPDARDAEYYGVVGSIYSEIFNKDNKDLKAQNIAKVALMKVLEQQPDNIAANMNFGLLYLNQAVNIVKSMDEDIDLTQIDALQENVVKLAKQSEQFILKVYKLDPKNRKACTALFYIYRMLYDLPKSDEFKKKAEDLGEKFESAESGNKQETKQPK